MSNLLNVDTWFMCRKMHDSAEINSGGYSNNFVDAQLPIASNQKKYFWVKWLKSEVVLHCIASHQVVTSGKFPLELGKKRKKETRVAETRDLQFLQKNKNESNNVIIHLSFETIESDFIIWTNLVFQFT